MERKRIVFTGGGSAGHVTPNIAIINEMNQEEWQIYYIGSKTGIEKELIEKLNISYYGISSGKLRRYIDVENIIDSFRVMKGCLEARSILKKIKPCAVFSKGGFVSVPVIIAARSLDIPIIIHESDYTPGLANRISKSFATKVYTSFEEAKKHFPANKTRVIGSPIRREILTGSKKVGLDFLGFHHGLPVLTIMGGSLGSKIMNETIREALPSLLKKYQIVHLCGKGNVSDSLSNIPGYKQYEYIHEELSHILAATEIVITRGGSNAIFEFLALRIPMLIIPLSKKQSRGDQLLNGRSFEAKGYASMLEEERLNQETFIQLLEQVTRDKEKIIEAMKCQEEGDALRILLDEMENIASR
ncbi:undecaprenyldiphospho-muramoylpentapeptide beta-N-acetylglucosaminyltransferase [Priestia taiwanensis]|uniref:UDP-N-acetylglucosamine--N-acetylmuramyl-(pentapeptide) pyrophosphoryl-undecaprenol N-acetylglucosamine transferase n=1 Tax=Priestia taiwanensis TaxID=1347902 RepID=A0A917ENI8_9BACI|nr:undecaprenyldiphospho-muramoylpentapeptide beta-N-acetylglucosaminyltransferase [Priestia taiwanensis]MBM7362544.1 UDP-N-acetylglucosamine--N-acetylmuramyl-(pentapeptide) pyrophosphoryl-undecaprenol N-acetylglucosamine transferase [Priestia taiwanensis]GGE63081.1 UDP-N-acetylglucosamine--N-acetylmuramyl-(pentapeptide) pyrophosphoryl-undecaprenol N-acetylglucosamine transferase 2 [Priestia taiwanensis]